MKNILSFATMMGVLGSLPASATSMVALSQDQMVDASTAVVHGVVTEVWTEEDTKGVVWTRAQVEVRETYKGDTAVKAYIVDQIGGRFGGNTTGMAGTARFSIGEDAIFFLETLGNGRTTTVGLSQGKFTTRMDPYTQLQVVTRFAPPAHQKYDHRFIPLPAEDDRIYLSDFVERIQDRVQQGWDGQAIPGVSIERLQTINKIEVAR